MDEREALDRARDWVAHRREVRTHLIALARKANPVNAETVPPRDGQGFWNSFVRKLYQFPSDLNEERLLDLIDNGKVDVL